MASDLNSWARQWCVLLLLLWLFQPAVHLTAADNIIHPQTLLPPFCSPPAFAARCLLHRRVRARPGGVHSCAAGGNAAGGCTLCRCVAVAHGEMLYHEALSCCSAMWRLCCSVYACSCACLLLLVAAHFAVMWLWRTVRAAAAATAWQFGSATECALLYGGNLEQQQCAQHATAVACSVYFGQAFAGCAVLCVCWLTLLLTCLWCWPQQLHVAACAACPAP